MDRPLRGEPLALDLLNTRWVDAGREHDALATVGGLAAWLRERGLPRRHATDAARRALVDTRETIRDVIAGVPGAEERLNDVLARGMVVRTLDGNHVGRRVVFADDTWAMPWTACDDYLELISSGADRIHRCEGAGCILSFYDPTGRRRWCSMAACGNRAKARRHQQRQRAHGTSGSAPGKR